MLLAVDDPGSSEPPIQDGVYLTELSGMTGTRVAKLSALAIAGAFPSSTMGGNRRVVDRKVADALAALLPAGLDQRIVLRVFFADPDGVTAAVSEAARRLASPESED